uniref:Uncharacterized protein n=1 Tax=Serinus canaria TaxID=9135 RepID=A0A8C9MS79_SERCA
HWGHQGTAWGQPGVASSWSLGQFLLDLAGLSEEPPEFWGSVPPCPGDPSILLPAEFLGVGDASPGCPQVSPTGRVPAEVLPVGIIAGATIGASILLISCLLALACFLYRRRKEVSGDRGHSGDTWGHLGDHFPGGTTSGGTYVRGRLGCILLISCLLALACFLYRRRKGSEWGQGTLGDTLWSLWVSLWRSLHGHSVVTLGVSVGVSMEINSWSLSGHSVVTQGSLCGHPAVTQWSLCAHYGGHPLVTQWSPSGHSGAPAGRKDVTLRKLDIKVETVNREPLTLHGDREEDTASVSTATRVMKAIYSSFKDDVDLKQDLRCDTIDTREEYELKVRSPRDSRVGKEGHFPNYFLVFSPLERAQWKSPGISGVRSWNCWDGEGILGMCSSDLQDRGWDRREWVETFQGGIWGGF